MPKTSLETDIPSINIPNRGGIGLRTPHYQEIINDLPKIDWLEVHSENFFGKGGIILSVLTRIRENYPLSFHGVGLSLGSSDKINVAHLKILKEIVRRFEPGLVSEHLSWSSINNKFLNDLLPVPYTLETLNLFKGKINYVQDYLQTQILIENPSSYLAFNVSHIKEEEFLNELANQTGCAILLDINNIYVSSINNDLDAFEYINSISKKHVKEIHLAGHSELVRDEERLLIDTHNNVVCEEVWQLYEHAISQYGAKPTLIEWDADIPALEILMQEADIANRILDKKVKTNAA